MAEQLQKVKALPAEKRSCPRYPFTAAAEVLDIQGNTNINGRVSDISRNGCYIDTISPFAVKTAINLVITKDSLSFKTQAKVVYSQVGMGMGILFTTAEPEQLRVLGTLIADLSGEKAAEVIVPSPEPKPNGVKVSDPEPRNVLSELIILLSRKDILNDTEAKVLMQKLFK